VSPLRWTAKSTRALAAELTRQGHRVSADTVGDLLRAEWFSLQGNAKTIEGKRHPDRDAQFRYISEQASAHQAAGQPVISVDRGVNHQPIRAGLRPDAPPAGRARAQQPRK
jgi:hypothetical protein